MILESTINKFLRDTINLILNDNNYSIADDQDAPRPNDPYGTVGFLTDLGRGWEQQTLTDNQGDLDITETIEGMREITMSLNFYKANAIDNSRRVRIGLVRESVQQMFSAANLGLTSRSEVRKLSEPLEDGWEERAQFDVVLSAIGTDSDIITSIQSVDIAGIYQARGLEYNFNIEVP